jgi:hypothetical protein
MALVKGSIHDTALRFLILNPEQQDWCHMHVNAKQSILVQYTTENEAMARDIAQIFPIRLRYYGKDRFDNLMPATSDTAKMFRVTCRYAETWPDLATLDPGEFMDIQRMSQLAKLLKWEQPNEG